MATTETRQDVLDETLPDYKIGAKKTLDEYAKLGMYTFVLLSHVLLFLQKYPAINPTLNWMRRAPHPHQRLNEL